MREENKYYTVSAITNYISYKISTDAALKLVYIKGEMSNVRLSKGHLYFVLKDEEAEISGIIFANIVNRLSFTPKDGMKVLITGSITPYAKRGTYNLLVNEIIEYGEGYLYQRFLELKDRLEKIGLFSEAHKKPIPEFSKRIGVITSGTGDAINDIISTIQKRYPLVEIHVYPCLVQGSDAPRSIINALNRVAFDNDCDVVIIARGGGSFEDLNCFNDEGLAKAIYDFPIPIISGVGHENDYTICDFVADGRAPTPTGAAVRVTPDKNVLINNLETSIHKLNILMTKIIDNKFNQLDLINNNYYFKSFDNVINSYYLSYKDLFNKLENNSPINKINKVFDDVNNLSLRITTYNILKKIDDREEKINQLESNIIKSITNNYKNYENSFNRVLDKLILVNPLNIMKKGYTLVYKDNQLITSSNDVIENDELKLHFHDGVRDIIVKK